MRVDRIGTYLFAGVLLGAGFWGCDGGGGGTGGDGGSTTSEPTTTTTTSTTTTGPTTTTTGGGPSYLGLECVADSDCGMGGKCLLASDNDAILGGGPAGGYCTKPCADDSECPNGTCLDDGAGNSECFLNCTFGDPPLESLNTPLDENKCHGREDLRCQELQSGAQICLPSCGSDDQCEGRSCDPRLSVCVDTPNTGKALGEACDPMAAMTDCAGSCIGITGGKSMCTSPCAMGGAVETSYECGGADKGVCLYSPSGTGVGDLGFCAETCQAHDQCQYPAFFCFDLGLANVGLDYGICIDSKACTTNADCDFLNGTCIETTVGKYCMSDLYPLGTLEPMGMGGGGAGGGGAGGGGGGMGGGGAGGGGAGGSP